jgi:hypothetical protein
MSEQPLTKTEFRVLRHVRSGGSRDLISPSILEMLKAKSLVKEAANGLLITDEGLRRLERPSGLPRARRVASRR